MNSTSNSLYDKTYYTAPTNYIISSYIREYDISKANINVLYLKGAISKEEYDNLFAMDKKRREIIVGLKQGSDPELSRILKEGIKEMRYLFLTQNNIQDSDILSIKNDAIFVINKIPTITKFHNVEFMFKELYTSFYKLGKLELYYLYDMVTETEKIEVKGIKDDILSLHREYFLEFLLVIFNSAQTESIQDTMKILLSFYEKYINLELDIGYYRPFNQDSKFYIKKFGIVSYYKADFLSNNDKMDIDISYNLNILRELASIFSTIIDKNMQ